MSFPDSPDYSAEMRAQLKDTKLARAEASERAKEDQIFAREQAAIERQAAATLSSQQAARAKKEEKARIKALAAAEGNAIESAEEMAEATSTNKDRDQGFSNMFSSLLKGTQGGGRSSVPSMLQNILKSSKRSRSGRS